MKLAVCCAHVAPAVQATLTVLARSSQLQSAGCRLGLSWLRKQQISYHHDLIRRGHGHDLIKRGHGHGVHLRVSARRLGQSPLNMTGKKRAFVLLCTRTVNKDSAQPPHLRTMVRKVGRQRVDKLVHAGDMIKLNPLRSYEGASLHACHHACMLAILNSRWPYPKRNAAQCKICRVDLHAITMRGKRG
eukprot:365321-Chlamydomonas_euryale.AAC.18